MSRQKAEQANKLAHKLLAKMPEDPSVALTVVTIMTAAILSAITDTHRDALDGANVFKKALDEQLGLAVDRGIWQSSSLQ